MWGPIQDVEVDGDLEVEVDVEEYVYGYVRIFPYQFVAGRLCVGKVLWTILWVAQTVG